MGSRTYPNWRSQTILDTLWRTLEDTCDYIQPILLHTKTTNWNLFYLKFTQKTTFSANFRCCGVEFWNMNKTKSWIKNPLPKFHVFATKEFNAKIKVAIHSSQQQYFFVADGGISWIWDFEIFEKRNFYQYEKSKGPILILIFALTKDFNKIIA